MALDATELMNIKYSEPVIEEVRDLRLCTETHECHTEVLIVHIVFITLICHICFYIQGDS